MEKELNLSPLCNRRATALGGMGQIPSVPTEFIEIVRSADSEAVWVQSIIVNEMGPELILEISAHPNISTDTVIQSYTWGIYGLGVMQIVWRVLRYWTKVYAPSTH